MKALEPEEYRQCVRFLKHIERDQGYRKGTRVMCSCANVWQLRRRRSLRALVHGDWWKSRRSEKMFWVLVDPTVEELMGEAYKYI